MAQSEPRTPEGKVFPYFLRSKCYKIVSVLYWTYRKKVQAINKEDGDSVAPCTCPILGWIPVWTLWHGVQDTTGIKVPPDVPAQHSQY